MSCDFHEVKAMILRAFVGQISRIRSFSMHMVNLLTLLAVIGRVILRAVADFGSGLGKAESVLTIIMHIIRFTGGADPQTKERPWAE